MTFAFTKAFLLTSALGLAFSAAQAQVTFQAGPSVGLNVSTVHFAEKPTSSINYRVGLNAGILSTIGLGHIALQPGLFYSQKGFIARDVVDVRNGGNQPTIRDAATKSAILLHYVTIPLNLAYRQTTDGQGFQVFAGPYASLLLSGHQHLTVTAPGGAELTNYDRKITAVNAAAPDYNGLAEDDYARRFDFGVQGGVGYCRGPVLVQAAYSVGLRTIQPDFFFNGTPVTSPDYYNRGFQLSLTYLFGAMK